LQTGCHSAAYLHHIDEVQRIQILGCPVDVVSLSETVEHARRAIADGRSITQVSINALKVGLADDDPAFREALEGFDLSGADGVPIVWAARLLGTPIRGRVNGTDLMYELLALAEREGLSVYLLGARREALDAATSELRRGYPRLRIAGTRDGYWRPDEEAGVVAEVTRSSPDILLLALPSPRKEWFLLEHAKAVGAGFAMGVGGSIDVLAGLQPRAPAWMQRSGLEWLHRLVRDPRGMWRRYLTTNVRFVTMLFGAVAKRVWGPAPREIRRP
jgi:N-acetylglucosaminyldiphosphoundecaprenol N-acetyl-beta-D-mannosaminyltransferase